MTETTEAPAAATQPDKKTPTEGTNPDATTTPNEEQQAANGADEKKVVVEEKEATPPQEPPKEMRAVVLTGFGGFKGVKILKKPEPTLQAGEVLIRVRSCGLNFQDLMVRLGAIDSPPKTPCILGLECAGEVEAIGEGVENFKVGDRVVALPEFKAWAELVTVPAKYVYNIPDEMSFADAAAIAINYVVAYILLFDLASIKSGKTLLLHSAGGGVGQAIVQLARTIDNVQVFGVCSKNKHEALKAGGLIDHLLERGSDYTNEVRKISPEGVDIVLDCLCGEECNRSYTLLKPMGKYILYGSSNVVTGETKSFFSVARSWWQVDKVSPIKLFDENKSLAGFNLRHLLYQQDGVEYVKNTMATVFDLWKDGKIKPTIDSTWALEDVAEAMQKMHDRKNIGKLVLDPAMEPNPNPATPAKGKAKAKKEASEEKNGDKEKKPEEGEKKEEVNDKEATEVEAKAAEKENGDATESEKQSS
uniref:Putative zinc-binding oxidoreductase n=1 Tax=Nyssomyia neivai TaxID=330878 RepID=A0A1L8E163_9DIPT